MTEVSPQTPTQWLQHWYAVNCDGQWEHSNGVEIETLDNPGWSVVVDLRGTDLEGRDMPSYACDNGGRDWVFCKIEDGRFVGNGDPSKLECIIDRFRAWATWASSPQG